MLERVFRASEVAKQLHDRLKSGQEIKGGCTLVTAIAGSPQVRPDKIPLLDTFHEGILALRERRGNNRHHCPKRGDVTEIVERLSGGESTTVGSWLVEADDGRFIDNVARKPMVAARSLLSGKKDEKTLDGVKVTGIMIHQEYPGSKSAHALVIIPDQQAFTRDIRREAKRIARKYGEQAHLVVDAKIKDSGLGMSGVTLSSGKNIAEYVTSPDSQKGTPQAWFHFILTKK